MSLNVSKLKTLAIILVVAVIVVVSAVLLRPAPEPIQAPVSASVPEPVRTLAPAPAPAPAPAASAPEIPSGWDAMYFSCSNGTVHILSPEDAERAYHLLLTMQAEELLSPPVSQQSNSLFTLWIEYDEYKDEPWHTETIYLTGCGRYFFRYTDTTGEHGDREYFGGFNKALYALLAALVVPVSIDDAEEEILNSFKSFDEFVDEESAHRIIITTNATLRNFSFIEIDFSETEPFLRAGNILYSADELLPERPLVVTWSSRDLPHRGISFVDENGIARYFSINTSGYDGSRFLFELRPPTY